MRKPDRLKMDRAICAAAWTNPHAQRLMEVLGYDIGPRPAGSRSYKAAVKLLSGELGRIGARGVHMEPVPVLGWRPGESHVALLSPYQRAYDSVHHVHSAPGNVTGPLVDAGSGTTGELDRLGKRLQGAVALVAGHQVSGGKVKPYLAMLGELARRGASAILMRCMYPHVGPSIELAGVSRDLPISATGISYEAGHELVSLARRGRARVRIGAGGRSYRTRCRNLVAEVGPARGGDGVVILSAHLDHFHTNPGALDNLSGVVTLMETAGALVPFRAKFRRTLRLILFTAEEYGFIGSKCYVRSHAGELDSVRFVLNMDSLFPETAQGLAVMWAPDMRDYIEKAFRETQCCVDVRSMFCMSSDYLPFMLAGVATARPADFHDRFPLWSHTRHDTPDKIPAAWVRMNAMTWAQLLVRILTDPRALPVKRKSPQEVRALVEKEDAIEALAASECVVP